MTRSPATIAPSLVLRAYRGPEDHRDMAPVTAAVRAFNGDSDVGTVADMDNHYGNMPLADLPRDCVLVLVHGVVRAYGRASREELMNGDLQVATVANVHPDFRGIGIEERLLDRAIHRAGEIVAEHGVGRTSYLSAYCTGRDTTQQACLEARGFQRVRRYCELTRPDFEAIPDLPLPEPLVLRPIGADDRAMHRRVYDAAKRAFADTHGETGASDAEFEEFLGEAGFNPPLWRVAFDGDRIAGQILNYLGEPEANGTTIGWTESISVQPEYRRRGLARALLAESLRTVRDAGATCAALGVDTQNPNQAQTLYESLGFRVTSDTFEYRLATLPSPDADREPRESRA